MTSSISLLVALLVSSDVADHASGGRLVPAERVGGDVDRLLAPAPVPRSAPRAPRSEASTARAALGYLAGDAAAAAVAVATFAAYLGLRGDDSGMGAIGPGMATAMAALALPPLAGSFAASRSRGPIASPSAFVLGGLAHAAGLAGAVALLVAERPRPWVAAGLVLAVDLTIAPWITARQLRRPEPAAEPPAAYALPVR